MQVKMFFLLIGTILLFNQAQAQELELPRKSPKASVSYTIGMTEITIDYSSPAVNDRTIWGELVPYGEVWRAGANEATTMAFSTEVNIEGKILEAGKYSFFLIPREGEEAWTAIFNSNTELWGTYGYNDEQDVVRIDINPRFGKVSVDRLEYSIHDQDIDKGYIKMAWGKARVYLRMQVEVMDQAMANIEDAIENGPEDQKWMIYAQSADFLLEHEGDMDQAMEWIEKSTEMYAHSWNWFMKARIQAAKGDFAGAIASAKKSEEVGMANADDNFYSSSKKMIEQTVEEWKSKM